MIDLYEEINRHERSLEILDLLKFAKTINRNRHEDLIWRKRMGFRTFRQLHKIDIGERAIKRIEAYYLKLQK